MSAAAGGMGSGRGGASSDGASPSSFSLGRPACLDTIFSRRNRHTLNSANAAARLMHAPVPLHWRNLQRSQYNIGRMYPRGRARARMCHGR